jgi:holo-[acyl-carrier protein] synthase
VIIGVGVDTVLVRRVAALLARHGERAESRVFTPGEISYCQGKVNSSQHLAARFAAKEALMKAIGHGIAQGIGFSEIEVESDGRSRPQLRLSGRAGELAREAGVKSVHLSLTHTDDDGTAIVVLEG